MEKKLSIEVIPVQIRLWHRLSRTEFCGCCIPESTYLICMTRLICLNNYRVAVWIQNCFGLELMPLSPQKAKVTCGLWYSWASAGDAQALTSACRCQSGFILWMCFCAKVLFIRARTCFQRLFFSPSSVLSPSGNSYPTNSRCLSFTWCPKFSADPQKIEMFPGRQERSYATVNWNRTTSGSFSFHKKHSAVRRVEFWGLNPVSFFPFACSIVNVNHLDYERIQWMKGKKTVIWGLNFFFLMYPK